jgi:hypothetical protein
MDLDRLRKLYKLAANNSNKNEAAVAALKFIEAVGQQDLNMSLYKGDAPPTRQQIEQALREQFQNGYQKGRLDLINEIRQQQINQRTTGGLYFGNRTSQNY